MRALMPILEWLPAYRRAWLPGDLAAGAAVWAVLVPFASLRLARFRYGPLEWLWRRLTYGSGSLVRP